MAYNTCLSTVVDVAPADDMASDIFLRPSLSLRLADTVTLRLCTIFEFEISQSSMIHPFDQCGPTIPS